MWVEAIEILCKSNKMLNFVENVEFGTTEKWL